MHFQAETVVDGFVGRITDIDLRASLDAAEAKSVRTAWRNFPVLVFPRQHLEPAHLRRFGEVFGPPEPEPPMNQDYLVDGEAAISYVGNIHPDGTPYPFGNQRATAWHSDQSYVTAPVKAGILHALEVPAEGGGTMFCNMYDAYAAVDDASQAHLAERHALHGYNQGPDGDAGPPLDEEKHGNWAAVQHPLIRKHPDTGRPALYVNRIHTFGIAGMTPHEGRRLLKDLLDHATQERFVHYHRWEVGDVVVWDHRCLMHKSAGDYPHEQRRLLMRVKIAGDRPN